MPVVPTMPTSTVESLRMDVDALANSPLIKERNICELAASLPAGDICARMCDPDAMKAQLRDEGAHSGTCYDFRCNLPDDTAVYVGVCLPPN